jgi:hypothetical protein
MIFSSLTTMIPIGRFETTHRTRPRLCANDYPDTVLRTTVKQLFPAALEWDPIGLPNTYLPLLAPNRKAFVREGERVVSHGGVCIEELIVPLVQIERRGA